METDRGRSKMSVIDDIKQRLDIVEVTSDYVPDLKKVGRNFKALCPFHPETVGSFYIFPERQSWHCFGACGTGGDIFSFVMRKEGVDFGEALRILAQKAGVSLETKKDSQREEATDRLKRINEAAAEYYHHVLLHSSQAQEARNYLAKRGVSQEMIEEFYLGFSPDSWDALHGEFIKRGYREKDLISAGLLVEKDSGGTYDRFRNRLMFPIRDISGRVLSFGGRALDDSLPKYLNSPQTAIFDKSGTLYGIDQAKGAIRKQDLAVLVEGYTDVLAAHQYGFNNVVASLGTALTEKHITIIKKLTKSLTLALDADAAGEMATLRGIEIASRTFDQKVVPLPTSQGLVKYENLLDAEIKVMVLPAGKDPDDIIKGNPEDWLRLLEGASPVIDYTFHMVISKTDLTSSVDKSQAVDQLLPLIHEIKHPVRQAHYLQKLSRLVAVDEHTLASALNQMRPSRTKRKDRLGPSSTLVPSLSPGDPLAEYCLSLLLRSPRLQNYAQEISTDYFENSESRVLFLIWNENHNLDSMRQRLDSSLQDYLDMLLVKSLPPMTEEEECKAIADCTHRLKMRWLRELKTKEKVLISDAQAEGIDSELEDLQQSGIILNNQLKNIFLSGRDIKNKGREE